MARLRRRALDARAQRRRAHQAARGHAHRQVSELRRATRRRRGVGDRHVFQTRPKMAGLWIHLRFRDGEVMEGIIPNNLMGLESGGFSVIPPNPFGNLQRIFVPKSALIGVEVLGVVGSPLRKRKPKEAPKDQGGLFDQPAEP